MIDIDKKISFYFCEKFGKCKVFSHLRLVRKMCYYTLFETALQCTIHCNALTLPYAVTVLHCPALSCTAFATCSAMNNIVDLNFLNPFYLIIPSCS
jgi:hypothetical protein